MAECEALETVRRFVLEKAEIIFPTPSAAWEFMGWLDDIAQVAKCISTEELRRRRARLREEFGP